MLRFKNITGFRKPSGRGLASSAGGPGFNPKLRTGSFSRIKAGEKVMDKIWDGNPWKLEVIGRCGGDEKK